MNEFQNRLSKKKSGLSKYIYLGNVLEHYDTALYALLSPFFAATFFSEKSYIQGLIFAYAVIPLGMLCRPLGALFFGFIGDRKGRGEALAYSMLGMGLASFFIALLPEKAGGVSPFFFLFARLCQNFCMAGENMGGAIYLLEGSSLEKQDQISSWYATSTVFGIVLASLAVFCCYAWGNIALLWRFLYFFGGSLALIAAVLRRSIPKELNFKKETRPLGQLIYREGKILFPLSMTAAFNYVTYSAAFVFINGFVPLVAFVSVEQMIFMNTALLGLDLLILPFFGKIASLLGRSLLMKSACLFTFILGIPLFKAFEGASVFQVAILRILLVILGASFAAPWHAWAQEKVLPSQRFLFISLGHSLGALLVGGPFSSFLIWMYQYTESLTLCGSIFSCLGMATYFTLFFFEKKETVAHLI